MKKSCLEERRGVGLCFGVCDVHCRDKKEGNKCRGIKGSDAYSLVKEWRIKNCLEERKGAGPRIFGSLSHSLRK